MSGKIYLDPEVERELMKGLQAEESGKPKPAEDEVILPPEFSEDALALRFSDRHGADWRYTAAWGRWFRWDGSTWRHDSVLSVFDAVRRLCRSEAARCVNDRISAKITSAATIAAVERLARSDRRHAAITEQWDADPWELNTPGGIVNLKTGVLQSPERLSYCTKSTAIAPAHTSECPRWKAFLGQVTAGDESVSRFMQRICGYALTGSIREHAMFFLYGTGANGKSVFLNSVSRMLGTYARTAPIETFTESQVSQHPTDVAGLQGARLVSAIETEEGRRWSESKLKALTGGDRVTARYMRQDFFEFDPVFKLFVAGNHKPGLRSVDEAIRRRMNLIPFTVTIPPGQRDTNLGEKLRHEWPGILRWAIDGCLDWQRNGLEQPEAVKESTKSYLEAEDALGRWIDDCCVISKQSFTSSAALFQSWVHWCETSGERPGSQRSFSQKLDNRDFKAGRTATTRGFFGIDLRKEE
jgi:putative DNA primase/helicase